MGSLILMGTASPTPPADSLLPTTAASTTTKPAAASATATADPGTLTIDTAAQQPPAIRELAASPSPPPRSSSQGPSASGEVDYRLPKNKSTGNLLAHASRIVTVPDSGRQRFSFDASAFESMSKYVPYVPAARS